MRKLSDLANGEKAYVAKVKGRGAFRRRLREMGFVRGKEIEVIKNAPLQDPIEYTILNYNITLRRSEASNVIVSNEKPESELNDINENGLVQLDNTTVEKFRDRGRVINVALVGNPNAGKTSIFNFASRSNEHTGNYSGVTIDSKMARVEYDGYILNLTDLPGTYSTSAFSPEELYVRDYIIREVPDVVINVVDASNLERNLFLTAQLIDMDIKVVLALNMYDELKKGNNSLNFIKLGQLLGMPVVPTVGSKGFGINELFQKIVSIYKDVDPIYRHIHINYGDELESSIGKIQEEIKRPANYEITDKVSSRYVALKLLEKDIHINDYIINAPNYDLIKKAAAKENERIEQLYNEETVSVITDSKYGFIGGALKETYKIGETGKREITTILDAFLTHKLFGFPVFFAFLWLMFTSTFVLGEFPMNWIDAGIGLLSDVVSKTMPEGSFKDLLIDGVIGGVGGVIVFLPNILLLFLFISFMEDSGYMARAVFIMDRVMHRIGLHGKSFISLIMGFGCNVPAIMSTRTIEDRNVRLLTILVNPFMSCSARLPVYLLVIGAIFPSYRGTILFSVYVFGIIVAICMALLFKKTLFSGKETPFVMELPPYRMPTVRSTVKHMWAKASQYLKKMGGIILVASIILWAMGYFPRTSDNSEKLLTEKNIIKKELKAIQQDDVEKSAGQKIVNMHEKLKNVNDKIEAERMEASYIGRIGVFIEPVIRPLGFDWKMGISLLSGVVAKEVVVSTLGVLYQSRDDEENQLMKKLRSEKYETGKQKGKSVFSPAAALSFIVFILIYFPCIAVIAAVRRESGSLKWALFIVFYTSALAWILSFLIYNTVNLIA